MRKNESFQKGFTLTELLVAITITSILMIGIMTFLVRTLADNSVRQARADLLREAQLSLDSMTKDIRLSAGVAEANVIPDDNSPDADNNFGLGWISDQDTLVLSKSVEDVNGNILFQDPARYVTEKNNIVYFTNQGNLYKRTIASDVEDNRNTTSCPANLASSDCPADVRLIQNVDSFQVRYFNGMNEEVDPDQARSVETSLTLIARKYGREVRAEYKTRTVFRNE